MYLNQIDSEIQFNNQSLFNQSVFILRSMLAQKTYETLEHTKRMEKLSKVFGQSLNLSREKLFEVRLLARLHDIGKVAIPAEILNKPDKLTEKEYEIIKTHSKLGYKLVKKLPFLDNVAKGILHHHERWDGNGYPYGLTGDNIPYISRIINIIDSYDVMTNVRPYKTAMEPVDALYEVHSQAGQQFDPYLADKFIQLLSKKYKFKEAI